MYTSRPRSYHFVRCLLLLFGSFLLLSVTVRVVCVCVCGYVCRRFFCFFYIPCMGGSPETHSTPQGQQDIGLRESFPPFVVLCSSNNNSQPGKRCNPAGGVMGFQLPQAGICVLSLFQVVNTTGLGLGLFVFLVSFSYKLAVRPSSIRRGSVLQQALPSSSSSSSPTGGFISSPFLIPYWPPPKKATTGENIYKTIIVFIYIRLANVHNQKIPTKKKNIVTVFVKIIYVCGFFFIIFILSRTSRVVTRS